MFAHSNNPIRMERLAADTYINVHWVKALK